MRIDIEEAKGKLPELVGKVVFGGENQVIITKRGMPVAKLIDYYSKPQGVKLGVADGLFEIPDDFDTMMSDEIAEMFGVK
ncbi:MAG: type II toxin-antitoxin system prevent-host-death family antitoxin [Synergistaceae bacterium]|nr:type II toxin-antitoxin system prevent-host-death family antitoxin [Synergistaceae bacterium]MBQ3345724.1 type II toxin-antitoxin system prevent-host-death family antitoxin [Synergistaceae bacterium]MBQ3399180.1 type II toxin-antitoxin system prevent-host-death family antitoxin [Synergistaceae bacterium]MBQ3758012.1 type II toxin-antitoxin system prevent-host-death family antitoxin [Synergistaceae bacterium]MBQ6001365.1 type II toxin-antitoxin system prevent-host-death family antitoxin [Syne